MVFINKSKLKQDVLDKLEHQKSLKEGSYRLEAVIMQLKEDFHNKCYICETKGPHNINIEHFIPHRNDKDLKFCWDNLFWSCGHCNNIKSDDYNGDPDSQILNCTQREDQVESAIELRLNLVPDNTITVLPRRKDKIVANTAKLLSEVFNGTTVLKRIQATNIRNSIVEELFEFTRSLDVYQNSADEEVREQHRAKIIKELSVSSGYTSFKRWMIRRNPDLFTEFDRYFD